MPAIHWTHLPLTTTLARSSHALAVAGSKAYLFGGENVPRTPVDDVLYIIDLTDGAVTTSSAPLRPSARVGSCLVAQQDKLYLWGGRESREMTPCDASLWVYDIPSDKWERHAAEGDVPAERSYHCMTVSDNHLYLHAGCPTKGRLETLHSLSLTTLRWTRHTDAPPPGRGGTQLCALSLPSGQDVLLRYGGFAGYELSSLDTYHPTSSTWSTVSLPATAQTPGARSVHALVPYTTPLDTHCIALMFFGERDPAPVELGHDGAGKFHDDVWAVRYTPSENTSGNTSEYTFERLTVRGGQPEARGWFGAGVFRGEAGDRVVVQGGLNGRNERLGDLWVGEVV